MLKVEVRGKLFRGKDKSEWVDLQAGERVEELKEAEWLERNEASDPTLDGQERPPGGADS